MKVMTEKEGRKETKKKENSLTRCFIAIEISREAINEIEAIQNIIKKRKLFYGKLTEPENLHLTLKFLGEINEEIIEKVKEELRNIKIKEFEVSLGELGLFSEHIPRILWVRLMGKEVLELQAEIDKQLDNIFPKEERFMSHLTIARIKKVIDKRILLEYIKNLKHRKIKFKINEFILKKSELMPEGPIYSNLEKFKLRE